ncbi:MAG: hypothetical protein JWM54_2166 [Acidobacteriaceae bacterium]|nr:hypothetical protein [Acidobacteriaceae bacterium]
MSAVTKPLNPDGPENQPEETRREPREQPHKSRRLRLECCAMSGQLSPTRLRTISRGEMVARMN